MSEQNDKSPPHEEALKALAPDMLLALCDIELWWVEQGRYSFLGEPPEIVQVREVISKAIAAQ